MHFSESLVWNIVLYIKSYKHGGGPKLWVMPENFQVLEIYINGNDPEK
jgi:hypothetical protein